jgi:DnaJ-class molecular chaperone
VDEEDISSLLKDFVLYNGELLDPYQVLKVPKEAERSEIKQSYRKLSRLYHPDVVAFKDILPGACNNLDDVRDHWERITWSYQLLTDPRQRRKYDRHVTLADPGKAFQQAVAKAAWEGVASMGKGLGRGLWNVGSLAVTKLAEQAEPDPPPTEATVLQYQTKSQVQHPPSIVEPMVRPESVTPVINATVPESA